MKLVVSCMVLYAVSMATALPCELEVSDPWVREAPPTASVLAGYMVLSNTGGGDCVLVGARAAEFKRAMFHRTEEEGGVARMTHQEQVTVAAHEQLVFEPGGLHIMLMQPIRPLREGDAVQVKLVLDNGDEEVVEFPPGATGLNGTIVADECETQFGYVLALNNDPDTE